MNICTIISRLLPKKKFKVRVRHFLKDKYVVEYTSYRFFPKWESLKFWFHQGHPGGTERWSINMWSYKEAESIARGINDMDDVFKYYIPEIDKEAEWKQAEFLHQKDNVPYKTKIIKHVELPI